ncbi:putative transporter [Cyphellophora attinorum]|uniref:Putative transporter n=1 Tax=Cyphellophora attinorum TaxID=1664694 RepID=A0A0N1NZ01_9EURO|nr:putative transporter [Phialophora attinorum]KPI39736.1 putative transporter [Phialophora attinorum]
MADIKTQTDTEVHMVDHVGTSSASPSPLEQGSQQFEPTTALDHKDPAFLPTITQSKDAATTPDAADVDTESASRQPNAPASVLFVAALNATVITTAIPTIVASLNSPSGYSWIGGAYLIANAAAAPIWAKLSDIWGRKPILLAAVAIFAMASVVCATAQSMKALIVGRAFQGSASGGLIMLTNVVVSDIFSMRERALWCWWINLPVCGVAGTLLLFFLDVHNPRTPLRKGVKAIDWAGSLSILAVVIMLLLGLDFGGATFPWDSPKVICLIVFGVVCILIFVFAEKKVARYPLMPMGIFKESSNVASLLVTAWHGMSFIAGEYYFPLYLQSAKAASPLRSGVLLVPLIVMTAGCGVLTGIIMHRTGKYRELGWIGTVLLTAGFGAFISLRPDTSIAAMVGFQLIAGAGSGLLFEPPLVALQAHIEQDNVATATSTFAFIRSLALAVSIILGGVVFQNSMDNRSDTLRASGLPADLVEALSGKNAAANVMLTHTITDPTQRDVVKDAFAWSLRNMWIMYTVIAFLGVISSGFVKQKELSKEHTETVTGLKEKSVDALLHPLQAVRSHVSGAGGTAAEEQERRTVAEEVAR